jgi:hypothetical protein
VKRKIFERELFVGYPEGVRKLFTDMLYMLDLNIKAVDRGYFNVLLSNTNDRSEDMLAWLDFVEQMVQIQDWIDIDEAIGS